MGQFKTTPSTQLAVTENEVFTTGRMKFYPDCVGGVWELGSFDFFEGKGLFGEAVTKVTESGSPNSTPSTFPNLTKSSSIL